MTKTKQDQSCKKQLWLFGQIWPQRKPGIRLYYYAVRMSILVHPFCHTTINVFFESFTTDRFALKLTRDLYRITTNESRQLWTIEMLVSEWLQNIPECLLYSQLGSAKVISVVNGRDAETKYVSVPIPGMLSTADVKPKQQTGWSADSCVLRRSGNTRL